MKNELINNPKVENQIENDNGQTNISKGTMHNKQKINYNKPQKAFIEKIKSKHRAPVIITAIIALTVIIALSGNLVIQTGDGEVVMGDLIKNFFSKHIFTNEKVASKNNNIKTNEKVNEIDQLSFSEIKNSIETYYGLENIIIKYVMWFDFYNIGGNGEVFVRYIIEGEDRNTIYTDIFSVRNTDYKKNKKLKNLLHLKKYYEFDYFVQSNKCFIVLHYREGSGGFLTFDVYGCDDFGNVAKVKPFDNYTDGYDLMIVNNKKFLVDKSSAIYSKKTNSFVFESNYKKLEYSDFKSSENSHVLTFAKNGSDLVFDDVLLGEEDYESNITLRKGDTIYTDIASAMKHFPGSELKYEEGVYDKFIAVNTGTTEIGFKNIFTRLVITVIE